MPATPDPASGSELTVVIVNWNAGELLARCLESLARHPPRLAHDLLVVDNASSDGSREWVLARAAAAAPGDPPLRVIANRENVGFARANNLAIAQSQAHLLFLLNPDAEVTSGAIDALLATLGADPGAAACAPRLRDGAGGLQPSVWPSPPTTLQILFEGLRLYRLLPRSLRARWLLGAHWDHRTRRTVDTFFGAAMLVRRAALAAVGAFDESFPLFGEDYEWCARARRGGWRLYFEPGAEVVHHGARSAAQRWSVEEIERVKAQASIHFQKIALGAGRFRRNQLAFAVVWLAMAASRKSRGRPAGDQLAIARLHWDAARQRREDAPSSPDTPRAARPTSDRQP